LQHHLAAACVHGVCHCLPALDLRAAVDAGCVEVALTLGTDLGGFGDDQSRVGALRVILGHQRRRRAARAGTIAGQWCHHDAVGQRDIAHLDWVEQRSGRTI